MSVDIKVMYVRDIIKIRRATMVTKDPPTLQLHGDDFSNTYLVSINGNETQDFTIVSKHILHVVLPEVLRNNARMHSIDAFAETFTSTPSSFLEPRIGIAPQWTSGLQKLVQQFVKVLLTTPGTSIFRQSEGGGLQQLVGMQISKYEIPTVISRVMLAVRRASEQVKTSQSRPGVPAAERLKAVTVEDVGFDTDVGGINVRVLLESEAGHMAIANMGLAHAPEIASSAS